MSNGQQRDRTNSRAAPGILIRRVHQIYLAIYAQKCTKFGTTPVQSSIMQILLNQPGIDQVALAGEIGIDRTTTSSVLSRLEMRGIVVREIDPENRRTKRAFLTERGTAMLFDMQQSIDEAHEQLVKPLNRAERKRFLDHLAHLVSVNNDRGRTFLRY